MAFKENSATRNKRGRDKNKEYDYRGQQDSVMNKKVDKRWFPLKIRGANCKITEQVMAAKLQATMEKAKN